MQERISKIEQRLWNQGEMLATVIERARTASEERERLRESLQANTEAISALSRALAVMEQAQQESNRKLNKLLSANGGDHRQWVDRGIIGGTGGALVGLLWLLERFLGG